MYTPESKPGVLGEHPPRELCVRTSVCVCAQKHCKEERNVTKRRFEFVVQLVVILLLSTLEEVSTSPPSPTHTSPVFS